jgi:RHS repeat-associated protein
MDYLPFGEQIAGASGTSHKFTGDERDVETNLDHTDFRQYSSALGRWITPDPAGLAVVDPMNPQSWNRYAYVGNNAVSLIDPLGLSDCHPGEACWTFGANFGGDILGGGSIGGGGCGWSDFWSGDCAASQRLLDPSGRGQSELLKGEARYTSIINTGWDPELRIQYYTYSFAGGCNGALQCQMQLAAIRYGQQACPGQAPSAVADCMQQASNTLTVALDVNGNPLIVGGHYNSNYGTVVINEQAVDPTEFGCVFSRCGILDSMHFNFPLGITWIQPIPGSSP